MGLLDKMKVQAATATAQATAAAREAAQKGQARLDALQASRAADTLLRDLGAATYAERTGRGGPSGPALIERIVGTLRAYEQQHGPIDLGPESTPGAAGASASGGSATGTTN